MLLFAEFALPLSDFDFRRSRRVRRYEASVSQAVNRVLAAQIIFVEESNSDARNTDKNSL